jgi:hypothetical protein
MGPKARAYPDAKRAQGRRRPRAVNILAVLLVLTLGSLAAIVLSHRLREGHWEGAISPAATRTDAPVVLVEGIERPHPEATVGKAGEPPPPPPPPWLDDTDRLLLEVAGGVFILAFIVLLAGRLRPAREPVETHEKWASVPAETEALVAHTAMTQTGTGSIAAKRLSAVVWGDQVARRQEAARGA